MTEEWIPPKAAVIGSGRSGTGFVAALLDLLPGVSVGHENWFGPEQMGPDGHREQGLAVECSWLALPEIESMHWTGPVVHVIRSPRDCIKSLAEMGLFGRDAEPHPYRDFVRRHDPVSRLLEPVEAAMHWWWSWNLRCARVADLSVCLDDLPYLLDHVTSTLGLPCVDPEAAASIPRDVNHTPRGFDPTTRVEADEVEIESVVQYLLTDPYSQVAQRWSLAP